MRTYRKLKKTENEIEQLLKNTSSMSAVELSDSEKLKKQKELVWNLKTKPSKTEGEQEKIKMDIEKLSPSTLIKLCQELNDARDSLKSTLSKTQRVPKTSDR